MNPHKIESFEIEKDEELNSLLQEVVEEGGDSYISPTKRMTSQDTTRTNLIIDQRVGGSSRVRRVLAVILVGIVLLFATDSIEIKHTNKGEYKDGEVEQREDITDNPLLHYNPVVNEEAAIDVEAEAAGESVGSEKNKAKDNNRVRDDNHNPDADTDETAQKGNKDGNSLVDSIQEKSADLSPTSSTRFYKYTRRGQPIDEVERKGLADQWGSWTLVDPLLNQRPKHDFYAAYPNRDIPRTEFPTNAWQLDTDYVGTFLEQGLALVNRAMEAILSEYGHGREDEPNVDFEKRSEMFRFDLIQGNITHNDHSIDGATKRGGWTTARSWLNLKKRVLHSIMAQDSFIFAMGGHSAAAGHGNHFQQSYTLQVAWIMEPIFARLGVRHESRNFGNGGLGTAHNGIAAGSIYGPDVSLLMWDSGMTEGRQNHIIEMFARQAIIGGTKVPAIWHLPPGVAAPLHDLGDVDVGIIGSSRSGVPNPQTIEELEKVKWAVRYIKCGNEINGERCKPNRYNGTCWLDRPDGFVPPARQDAYPGGRAGWHPGNREHQIQGRTIAWLLLQALHEVLTEWKAAEDYALPDDAWHVTALYDNTRSKIAALDPSRTACKAFVELNMTYFCTVPFKARTEFTPRGYSTLTNIRTIMPKEMLENIPPLRKPIYLPPDVFNPYLHPPPGEIDVLNIVENGIDFLHVLDPPYAEEFYKSESTITTVYQKPGKGIYPHFYTGSDGCDGTLDSWCDRGLDNNCMLRAHNDGRTGFFFDSLSGWLIVNVPKVKRGYIVIRVESWHFPGEDPLTEGWTTVDNESREGESIRTLRGSNTKRTNVTMYHDKDAPFPVYPFSSPPDILIAASTSRDRRQLKKKRQHKPCDGLRFEYAIDDRPLKSLGGDMLKAYPYYNMQRVVETLTLLEEPDSWIEERDVQLAMRLTGCGRDKVWSLNNVYWA